MEIYCNGKIVRRESLSNNNGRKTRNREKYKSILKEVTQAAKLSDKKYWIELKVE